MWGMEKKKGREKYRSVLVTNFGSCALLACSCSSFFLFSFPFLFFSSFSLSDGLFRPGLRHWAVRVGYGRVGELCVCVGQGFKKWLKRKEGRCGYSGGESVSEGM